MLHTDVTVSDVTPIVSDVTDQVNTSENFLPKADTTPLVRFIRVTYVRPKYGLPPGGLYVPRQLTYEVFVPQDVSSDEETVVFESEHDTWKRVLAWLQLSGVWGVRVNTGEGVDQVIFLRCVGYNNVFPFTIIRLFN